MSKQVMGGWVGERVGEYMGEKAVQGHVRMGEWQWGEWGEAWEAVALARALMPAGAPASL